MEFLFKQIIRDRNNDNLEFLCKSIIYFCVN